MHENVTTKNLSQTKLIWIYKYKIGLSVNIKNFKS